MKLWKDNNNNNNNNINNHYNHQLALEPKSSHGLSKLPPSVPDSVCYKFPISDIYSNRFTYFLTASSHLFLGLPWQLFSSEVFSLRVCVCVLWTLYSPLSRIVISKFCSLNSNFTSLFIPILHTAFPLMVQICLLYQ